ncbi:kinesin light chain-like [Phymastichus coffea]|uniref:kinesin light chain-like n=1 Tax=Phymastichus coffea TaxID=108790 RepID=UPI00273A8245|nr:kinesin light chain-like [Phymastichus coffea]
MSFSLLTDTLQVSPRHYNSIKAVTTSKSSPTPMEQQSAAGLEEPTEFHNLNYTAIRYASQGCHEVAMTLCKQALKKLKINKGEDNPDVMMMLKTLSIVYHYQSRYENAMELLHDTLALGEKTLGETHPAVIDILNNLSVIYGRRGKNEEAESLCRRALKAREKIRGKNHPTVAKQLNNLALLCQSQNKYEEAIENFQRAFEIYETAFGPDDSNVAKTKSFLELCHSKLKVNEDIDPDAKQLFHQVSIKHDLLKTNSETMVRERKQELDAIDSCDEKGDLKISRNCPDNEEMNSEEKVNSSTSNEKDSVLTVQPVPMHKEQSANNGTGLPGLKKKIFRILGIRRNYDVP